MTKSQCQMNAQIPMSHFGHWLFLIFILCVLSGCATVYNQATGRQETMLISTADEVRIGQKMAAEIEKKYKPDEDIFVQARLRAIGNVIAAVSDRKDLTYYFKVLKDKDVNAFTTPGGYVYVFRGLIDKTGSDSELASVVAHEIGHVAARHAAKKMEIDMGYNLLMSIVFSGKSNADTARYIDIGFNLIALGYSREDELFADKLGIRYLIKAGYDPYGMVSFMEKMEKMEKEEGGAPIYILSSHPYMSQRIEEARKEIARQKTQKALQEQAVNDKI